MVRVSVKVFPGVRVHFGDRRRRKPKRPRVPSGQRTGMNWWDRPIVQLIKWKTGYDMTGKSTGDVLRDRHEAKRRRKLGG